MKLSKYKLSLSHVLLCLSFCSSMYCCELPADNGPEDFSLSFSERLRIETWDNAVTLSKTANAGISYLRNRITLGARWLPVKSLELNVKLANEFRKYLAPAQNDFHMNEVFIDQLNIKWKTDGLIDGVLSAGRQNINLGEGFVVMDGSPLDGSRSAYFNAVRYDWNIRKDHALCFFYSYQPATDKLPVINGNDIDASVQGDGTWKLLEQSEAGGGIYYTGVFSGLNLQSYYIRKDYLEPDAQKRQFKSGVNTIGSRISTAPTGPVSLTAELAYQAGHRDNGSLHAYGGYLYADFRPDWKCSSLPDMFTLGTVCLSGDDPATQDDEGWDPVFSRWPKWSELYVNTLIKEFAGRPAYWSDLMSIYGSVKFRPDDKFRISLDYHHMLSQYEGRGKGFIGGTGKNRGDLIIGKMMYNVSRTVTGTVIIEHFQPGDYYQDGAASATWARMEFNIIM